MSFDWLSKLTDSAAAHFFANFFDNLIKQFGSVLSDVMGTASNVLDMPLVVNGMFYAQALALVLLGAKVANEAFQTYILYKNGDPDADPSGLLIGTVQAIAVITSIPWLVREIFIFGTKLAQDTSNLSSGKAGIADWANITAQILTSGGAVLAVVFIIIVVLLLVIAIQATIRGAELALMAVLGPIMALNITANNRSIWSAWLKQVIIICTTQALQIFMISMALSMFTSQSISGGGLVKLFGWLWVTIKTPKYVQQISHSTGFSGSVGGGVKQAGSMYTMRRMMAK